jgi:hypothetical protein
MENGRMTQEMTQRAPYPQILADMVPRTDFIDGRRWDFRLRDIERGQDSAGLTLIINVTGPDTAHPEEDISVSHYMIVPAASYDERSWRDWLFEQIMLVLRHEAMEGFKIGGKTVYPPAHGPGNSPYLRLEYGSDEDRRMSFRGELNPR